MGAAGAGFDRIADDVKVDTKGTTEATEATDKRMSMNGFAGEPWATEKE